MYLSVRRAQRRLAVLAVALAAVGAGLALSTSPAHASGVSICLDANAQQVQNYGPVIQFQCNPNDSYQQWTALKFGHTSDGILVQLENVGAVDAQGNHYCLDANAQQIYNYGAVIQWECDSTDAFQLWNMIKVSPGHYEFQNWGALREGQFQLGGARHNGASVCLDANAQNVGNYGGIIQYKCNSGDLYQQWTRGVNAQGNVFLQNVGA
jgi:hypothetical protein